MRNRLRRIMRGYRYLKNADLLGMSGSIAQAFTNQKLNINQDCFSKVIFGAGIRHAEIICRQYLLLRCSGQNLNRALLNAIGNHSVLIPIMPLQWRNLLNNKGVRIASITSSLLWIAYIWVMFCFGVAKILKILFINTKVVLSCQTALEINHVYFDALSSTNLPTNGNDGRSFDIISWYMQWSGRSEIDAIFHSVEDDKQRFVCDRPLIAVSSPVQPLFDINSLLQFVLWSVAAVFIAAVDFLRGRWWHPLLLNQAALAAQARFQNPTCLAKEYLFHNSGWFFRPLWTYEAEKHGSLITFYFYSTNCEPFKRDNGYPPLPYGWQAMNWPRYLVWDEYQANFVRRAIETPADVRVVGPLWFHSTDTDMPLVKGKRIAVFDVTPFRASRYQTLGLDFEYYVPKTCNQFLQDIQLVARASGYKILWKRKRKMGSAVHPQYRYLEDRLSEYENIVTIDPDVAAHRVIESCDIVVSMPFTSTALIARQYGKPSCYYDPHGLIQQDDRAAHGIEIVTGRYALEMWIKAL